MATEINNPIPLYFGRNPSPSSPKPPAATSLHPFPSPSDATTSTAIAQQNQTSPSQQNQPSTRHQPRLINPTPTNGTNQAADSTTVHFHPAASTRLQPPKQIDFQNPINF
jgi:hypothetical protein